jgi:hypothetical protein
MKIEIYEEENGEWVDIFINEHKVIGDHTIQLRELLTFLQPYLPKETTISFKRWIYTDSEENPVVYNQTLGVY